MCLATYPFFRDVATATGRLLALQGAASQAQIVRRMAESWGERTTATRAVQRIVRSFVEWGVLVETGDRGTYAPAAKIPVAGVGPWLLEAGLLSSGRRERSGARGAGRDGRGPAPATRPDHDEPVGYATCRFQSVPWAVAPPRRTGVHRLG